MAVLEAPLKTTMPGLSEATLRRLIFVFAVACAASFVAPRLVERRAALTTVSLVPTLHQMRAALDLYHLQHHEYPGREGELAFRRQLLERTDRVGRVGDTPAHRYGPYLAEGLIPMNPLEGGNTVRVVGEMPLEPIGLEAWIYCWRTGVLRANSSGYTPTGNRYFDL